MILVHRDAELPHGASADKHDDDWERVSEASARTTVLAHCFIFSVDIDSDINDTIVVQFEPLMQLANCNLVEILYVPIGPVRERD